MTKHYITIGAVSIVIIAALVYGFFATGTPGETRMRKFDQTRVTDISSVRGKIESYYRNNKKLPEKLSDLTLSSYDKDKIKDPETREEYEYSITNSTSYKICATFATASDYNKDPYSYYSKEFEHPKGNHCFNLEIPSNLTKKATTNVTNLQKTTTFKDEKIKFVTSNASKIQSFSTVNFPYGFFSSNNNEWGLINYEEEPVTITISFNSFVKLSAISNTLTNCSETNCYSWSATGKTKKGTSVSLAENKTTTTAGISAENLIKEFNEVKITVIRLKGTNKYVHWKKISFMYK